MSGMSTLTAFDGASTPVQHDLVPISVSREKDEVTAVYREQLAGVPVYAQVGATLKLRKLPSGIYRASCRVEVPVMESISGNNAAGYTAAPKVAYVDTVDITGFFHERSTLSGRRLTRWLAKNIVSGSTVTGAVVTTGPFAELFDQLVMPT